MPLFKPSPVERDLAQLIFPELRPGEQDEGDLARLAELGVGGFCVYDGAKEEIARLCSALQSKAPEPLLMCGDYEWGTGRHVKGGTLFPPMMAVGASGSEELAYRKGLVTGREARALGVDWVLAPVVDLATRPENPIVNTRAFGDEPGAASRLARAFLRGLAEAGCRGCLKHFPGHGESWIDSHLDLPRLELSREALWERELVPYRELASSCGAVMLGHLLIPALDPEHPVSLSRAAVTGLLRGTLGFKGLVATDALLMGAIARHYGLKEAAVLAVNAGVDVLLVPQDPFALHAALVEAHEEGLLAPGRAAEAAERVRALKAGPRGPGREGLDAVGSPEHRAAADELAVAALAWMKRPAVTFLARGETASVLSLGETSGEERAAPFLDELKRGGVKLAAGGPGFKGKRVAAVFSSPRAFSGAINLSPEDARSLESAVSGGSAAVVSFGSPFVFPEAGRLAAGLAAFSGLESAQRAAARALLGAFEPPGRLPVRLGAARS